MEKNAGKHVGELPIPTISHIKASRETKDVDVKEVVVSNKAFELAKGWLRNMTKGDKEEEWEEELVESEMRPSRLGLGATYVAHPQVTHTMSALEKKLRAKLPSSKEAKNQNGKLFASQKNFKRNKDEDEDVSEVIEDLDDSRASAFQRKGRPVPYRFGLIKCNLNSEKSSKRKKR